MVEHIKQFIETVLKTKTPDRQYTHPSLTKLDFEVTPQLAVPEIAIALNKLDPMDFEPSFRSRVLEVRAIINYRATGKSTANDQTYRNDLRSVVEVLGGYRGLGSGQSTRNFSYLSNPSLRKIVERDYAELTIRLFPSEAWKSTVVIAGSILEAVLLDVLSHPTRVTKTNASPKGAKGRGGVPLDIRTDADDWTLFHFIEVAVDTGILPSERAATIHQVLRDYRNFVHPHKELSENYECSEAEAGLAKYALDGICNHLQTTL